MSATPTAKQLWIAASVLKKMRQLAIQHAPLETGGMILGYVADSGDTVVTAIIGAGPLARHRRVRFRPDHEYQQSQLDAHFAETQGRETYLGDWHTHPSGECALSRLDKRVLARIGSAPSSGTAPPLMIGLSGHDDEWRLCANQLLTFRRGLFSRVELIQLAPQFYE